MDNAGRRNIHAQAACREAGVYGAATDCASPTLGRSGKNSCRISANCAKIDTFSTGRFRVTAASLWMQAVVAPAVQAFHAAFLEIELRLRYAREGIDLSISTLGDPTARAPPLALEDRTATVLGVWRGLEIDSKRLPIVCQAARIAESLKRETAPTH